MPFLSSVTTHQKRKRDVNHSHQVGVKEKEMSSAKPDYRKLRRNLEVEVQAQKQKVLKPDHRKLRRNVGVEVQAQCKKAKPDHRKLRRNVEVEVQANAKERVPARSEQSSLGSSPITKASRPNPHHTKEVRRNCKDGVQIGHGAVDLKRERSGSTARIEAPNSGSGATMKCRP